MQNHWTDETERLRKVYGGMGDGQLEALAGEAYTLTDAARHALQDELAVRKMDVPLREAPIPKNAAARPELDLMVFRRVGDLSEARWLKQLLEDAGVASCLGPDNLYSLEQFGSEFRGGVDFKILRSDFERATEATRGLFPPEPADEQVDYVYEARCPECHSTEIVFMGREGDPEAEPAVDARFNWTCDHCGHQWTDDGIQQD